ncbi:tRNA (5-methylaminomethyl-2-thiouridine)(34)-methyltransferase MnmD [Flavobacterium sp.]|uniref:tRNA (5-methylaminomethyl-2-thiouridine)(34)-methyltransferase MnmD n=1 Tax=Flavobacterium sp. TaxID=239 RepID=UPI00260BE02C|nr:tRNA (5-methylaminomethyl-2-thiouridine)(34)-methyltransferase MnmD [Flavobacterium sp.]
MKREILTTKDGSTTIHLPDWDESYHSKHGAIQEAYHVFIKSGFSLFEQNKLSILEIGFGTGLNAFITYLEAQKSTKSIDYVGVEAYPVAAEEALQMNYVSELNASNELEIFNSMHSTDWETRCLIASEFYLTKRKQFFQDITDENAFDLIYFDAFGFRVQPELWSFEIFQKMYKALKLNGVLVTYACRSSIKNAMIECGFKVEKLPGAPGKREMLRAIKI